MRGGLLGGVEHDGGRAWRGGVGGGRGVLLGEQRELALLFKRLATLRTDAKLFRKVDGIAWRGPAPGFAAMAERLGAPRLAERAAKISADR